eukprot:6067960-Alexandrium_andersonii.AAC.1
MAILKLHGGVNATSEQSLLDGALVLTRAIVSFARAPPWREDGSSIRKCWCQHLAETGERSQAWCHVCQLHVH